MAELIKDPILEEAKELIVARGRERGFVTSEDLVEGLPVDDISPEQVEDFLSQIEEHLREQGIEVIEVPGEDLEDAAPTATRDEDGLKAPTNDPVRMYLKEIGKVPLLTAAQEVDFAMRIEAGEMATDVLRHVEDNGRVEGKALAKVIEFVPKIRGHQLEKFGRVEGIGRETTSKTWRPRTREQTDDFLRKVERDGQLAKKKLIEANLRLVVSIAKRYVGRGMLFLDLIQEGNLGLIRAVEKFDYAKGFKFSTYATWWIRQAIERGRADRSRTVRLPVHVVEKLNRLSRVERNLSTELGRDPTIEEVAAEAELSVEQIEQLREFTRSAVSLDTPIGDDGETIIGDLIEDADVLQPAEVAEHHEMTDGLRSLVASLPPREAAIISLRYGLDDGKQHTLAEVAERVGLTRERVRQLEKHALAELRNPKRHANLLPWAS